jgi:hypothetical protein
VGITGIAETTDLITGSLTAVAWYCSLVGGIDYACDTLNARTSDPIQGLSKIILVSLSFLSCVI